MAKKKPLTILDKALEERRIVKKGIHHFFKGINLGGKAEALEYVEQHADAVFADDSKEPPPVEKKDEPRDQSVSVIAQIFAPGFSYAHDGMMLVIHAKGTTACTKSEVASLKKSFGKKDSRNRTFNEVFEVKKA